MDRRAAPPIPAVPAVLPVSLSPAPVRQYAHDRGPLRAQPPRLSAAPLPAAGPQGVSSSLGDGMGGLFAAELFC